MAENLYKEWFVRFRFPGHENVKMVDGVPEGWKRYRLSEIADFNNSTLKLDSAQEIQYLDTSSVVKNEFTELQTLDIEDAPSRARRLVKDGSIVYSTVRPNLMHYGIIQPPPLIW